MSATEMVVPAPARRRGHADLLSRRAAAIALAEKLYDHATGRKDIDPGPTVVTIEGPWGSGKSTLLDVVREQLPHPPPATATADRLTVRKASRLLRTGTPPHPPTAAARGGRGVVTAWFNPWAHQSGEQVWAGLVAEIIEAAHPVLYPTESAREWYWFIRNLTRVDRYAVRRTLHRRMLSPELTLGALGVVASLAIAVAELETTVGVAGYSVSTAIIALLLSGTFLVLGAVHTGWRYLRASAARFLPGELFHGPVNSGASPDLDGDSGRSDGLTDPLRRARAGSLYLHQHDVSELVTDLDRAGYELIVFVDDLDRCRALTTAEVFEAINLFLAGFVGERRGTGRESAGDPGSSLRARFVIGLDPVVVAGHLDRVYADLYDPDTALDGEDPGPGWAFLRKLVHLPVLVPQISDQEMFGIVDHISSGRPVPRAPLGGTDRPQTGPAAPHAGPRAAATWAANPAQTATSAWRLPDHPEIRALIRARLAAHPDRSVREATRQLNLWEFYERVLSVAMPLDDPDQALTRSRRLVILGEIIARWPALQRFLHRRSGERTGLQLLAAAADDDEAWPRAADTVLGGRGSHDDALRTLRQLLREYDGVGIADLARQLL